MHKGLQERYMYRICVFYSHGPHFRKVLLSLRKSYPESHIAALLPPGYPSAVIRELVDTYEFTQYKQYRATQIGALLNLRKQIRKNTPDLFIVMFDSNRLRLLGSLSGVRERYCITQRGHWKHLHITPVRQIIRSTSNSLIGFLQFHRVRLHINRSVKVSSQAKKQ